MNPCSLRQQLILHAMHRRLTIAWLDEQEVSIPDCQGAIKDGTRPAKSVDVSSQLDLHGGNEPDDILDQERKSTCPARFKSGGFPTEPHESSKAQDGSPHKSGDPDGCVIHWKGIHLEDEGGQERARQTKEDCDGEIDREEVL